MNEKIYFAVRKEMNRRFPQYELEYMNGIIASAIAKGHKEKLTEDWLRRSLLSQVEDEFLTYEQAVYIKDSYFAGIEEVKAMY